MIVLNLYKDANNQNILVDLTMHRFYKSFLQILVFLFSLLIAQAYASAKNTQCQIEQNQEQIVIHNSKNHSQWQVKPLNISNFFNVNPIPVQASADCHWLVLLGHTNYRYVWLLNDQGFKTAIKTKGTPLDVAFSPDQSQIAVGTGAGQLLIINRRGQIVQEKYFNGILGQLQYFAKGTRIFTAFNGAVAILDQHGNSVKELGSRRLDNDQSSRFVISDDEQWLMVATESWHSFDTEEFTLLNNKGELVWSEAIRNGGAFMVNVSKEHLLLNDQAWPTVPLTEDEDPDQYEYSEYVVNHQLVARFAWFDASEVNAETAQVYADLNPEIRHRGFSNQNNLGFSTYNYDENHLKKILYLIKQIPQPPEIYFKLLAKFKS